MQNMVRLSSYETSLEKQTPRPLKVVMASEQQRKKVLSQAKNLKGNRDFEKVDLGVIFDPELCFSQHCKEKEIKLMQC